MLFLSPAQFLDVVQSLDESFSGYIQTEFLKTKTGEACAKCHYAFRFAEAFNIGLAMYVLRQFTKAAI